MAQSVAALVCEGFVIARNHQIYRPSWKTSKNHAKTSIYRKKTYRNGKHTALRGERGRPEKKDVSVGTFSTFRSFDINRVTLVGIQSGTTIARNVLGQAPEAPNIWCPRIWLFEASKSSNLCI